MAGKYKGGKTITMEIPNTIVEKVYIEGTGDDTFIYQQAEPSTVWNIVHNLNKYPSITVVDSAGTVVYGQAEYLSDDEVRLTFAAPFSGFAYLN